MILIDLVVHSSSQLYQEFRMVFSVFHWFPLLGITIITLWISMIFRGFLVVSGYSAMAVRNSRHPRYLMPVHITYL